MPRPADNQPDLCGRIILIAETNSLIALDLAETIRAWGGQPLLYNELPEQQQAVPPDEVCAALVDMSQSHQQHAGLIDALRQRNVPTVLTTAWQLDIIGNQFPGMTILEKPVNYAALEQWFADWTQCPPARHCCCG